MSIHASISSSSLDPVTYGDHLDDSANQRSQLDVAYPQDTVLHILVAVGRTVMGGMPSTSPKTVAGACRALVVFNNRVMTVT